MPSTLIVPICTCFALLPILLFTTFTTVHVNSMLIDTLSRDKGSPVILIMLHVINIIGGSWLYLFIFGVSQMILSITFATWYWRHDKNTMPEWTVIRAASITFK